MLPTFFLDPPPAPFSESALPDFANGQTFLVLALGQSNAASHGSPRSDAGANSFAFHDGQFYRGADPWIGGSGMGGSVWSRLGPRIVKAGLAEHVIVACVAQGSTLVRDWTPGTRNFATAAREISLLHDRSLEIYVVVWHQGESDVIAEPQKHLNYQVHLTNVIGGIRGSGVNSPVLVCLASTYQGIDANEMRIAQNDVCNAEAGVFIGADTDALGPEYRCDGVHFNSRGMDEFADNLLRAMIACINGNPTISQDGKP